VLVLSLDVAVTHNDLKSERNRHSNPMNRTLVYCLWISFYCVSWPNFGCSLNVFVSGETYKRRRMAGQRDLRARQIRCIHSEPQ
jgi:hypothetical protein